MFLMTYTDIVFYFECSDRMYYYTRVHFSHINGLFGASWLATSKLQQTVLQHSVDIAYS